MNAQELFDSIGFGRFQGVKVTNRNNREFRALVAEANMNGDCIINVGNGYYRPNHNIPIEAEEARHYIASERHRAKEILKKCESMEKAFQDNTAQISFL